MNNTKLPVSLEDTTELRKLIIGNPDLPLLFFVGDDAYSDDGYQYSMAYASNAEIQELTLYSDVWMDKEDYAEKLSDDLCDEEEYKDMTDDEYDAMIEQKGNATEFVNEVGIYVGKGEEYECTLRFRRLRSVKLRSC